MDSGGIIPDIIDTKPEALAQVTYENSLKLGNELQPKQVKNQPEVTWNAEKNSLYTLLMVDTDAPSRQKPTYREILHWLVINIPGNNVPEGQIVDHVFLVFKQSKQISTDTFIPNTSRKGRLNVKTRNYIIQYNLGNPIAGNYYQAQYDDYVPILQSQLSSK